MPAQYLPGGGAALTHGWSPRHIAACLVPARLDAQPALLLLAAPCSWEKKKHLLLPKRSVSRFYSPSCLPSSHLCTAAMSAIIVCPLKLSQSVYLFWRNSGGCDLRLAASPRLSSLLFDMI